MKKGTFILISIAIFILWGYSLGYPYSLENKKVNVRIKDLATIQGSNTNQLIGYGLVTGLKNTGDRTKTLSSAMIKNMLDNMGLKMDPTQLSQLQTKNTATVMITANLPASFRSGDYTDVMVSSMGDATSIQGGVLLLATLRGPDGKVYASAQGPVTVGMDANDARGRKKYLVGRIPDGGIICRNMDAPVIRNGKMTWVLRHPDFTTVKRVVEAINKHFHRSIAKPGGNRFIIIDCAGISDDASILAARIGQLKVKPDNRAKVVINERTGTVVMGTNVKVLPVVISQGNLTLKVEKKALKVKKDSTENSGDENSNIQKNRIIPLGGNATIRDVIDTLNYIGVTPKDLITILQALKNAGALQGELVIQ